MGKHDRCSDMDAREMSIEAATVRWRRTDDGDFTKGQHSRASPSSTL